MVFLIYHNPEDGSWDWQARDHEDGTMYCYSEDQWGTEQEARNAVAKFVKEVATATVELSKYNSWDN